MARRWALAACALSRLSCALLAALLPPSAARADNGVVGATGGSAYPLWTTDIRLGGETVHATCFGSFAECRIDFRFVNDGRARPAATGWRLRRHSSRAGLASESASGRGSASE